MQLRPGSIGGMVQSAAIPPWAVGFVAMRSGISSRRSIRSCPLGCSGLARGAGQTGSALARFGGMVRCMGLGRLIWEMSDGTFLTYDAYYLVKVHP